ncbi:hypothetical protein CLU79DRAFT_743173 [Phycomyces nitens]|nr:hypothetical protein CLU79DRAFT_743173 [Phycomyces nitens]
MSFFPTSPITTVNQDSDSNNEAEKRWLIWSNALLRSYRSSISGSIADFQYLDFKRYTHPLSKQEYDTLHKIRRPPISIRAYRNCAVSPSATIPSNKAQQSLPGPSFGVGSRIEEYMPNTCEATSKQTACDSRPNSERAYSYGYQKELRRSLDVTFPSRVFSYASRTPGTAHFRPESAPAVLITPEPPQLPVVIPMLRHHTISSMSSLSIHSIVEQNDIQSRNISAIWVDSFGKSHKNYFYVGQMTTTTQEPDSVRASFGHFISPCSTDSLLFLFGFLFFPLWWIGAWRHLKYPSNGANCSKDKSLWALSAREIGQLNCWMSVSSILIVGILVGLLVWLGKDGSRR